MMVRLWFLRSTPQRQLHRSETSNSMKKVGGISFNSSIILLLSHNQKGYLFLYRGGKIKGLAEFNSTGWGEIEVKHRSSSKIIFLVRMYAPYERGDNPLFLFDGEQLFRVKEYSELHDASVDPSEKRIAYCYWEGDKRHIVIKELNYEWIVRLTTSCSAPPRIL